MPSAPRRNSKKLRSDHHCPNECTAGAFHRGAHSYLTKYPRQFDSSQIMDTSSLVSISRPEAISPSYIEQLVRTPNDYANAESSQRRTHSRILRNNTKSMVQHIESTKTEGTWLLTRGDLSERLNVSKRTISRMLSAGELPRPVRIGRLVRWRESDIEEFIDRSVDPR